MATRLTRSRATVRSAPKPLSPSIPAEAGGSSLNQALGAVVLRESGKGVAGLVVTVYDVNRHPPGPGR